MPVMHDVHAIYWFGVKTFLINDEQIGWKNY
jgi:hypothetical protein